MDTAAPPVKRNTHDKTYMRNRAQAFATTDTCWLCGQFVDQTLQWPDPWSKSADHVLPLSRGGHLHGEVRLAHLQCNKKRGRTMPPVPHARNW